MSLKTPDPMATMSAHPKPTPDPAALIASILRMADAHYARKHWLAARDFLSLAVQINPDYPRLLGSLGSLQFQLQEFPAACTTFSAAVRQSPDNPDLHIQLAMVHLELKQVDAAKAALQRSLSLRPNNPTARQMLGDLDFAAKRYADAAQQYCALLESNPDGVNLLLHLGKCLYELRDLASARWCFDRVIALEPTNAIASEGLQVLAGNRSMDLQATSAEREGCLPSAEGDPALGLADRQGKSEAKEGPVVNGDLLTSPLQKPSRGERMTIRELYDHRAATPSDISEHMPRLRDLASECEHITEFGVRSGNSTIAFLAGLSEKSEFPWCMLRSYDINWCEVPQCEHCAAWNFTQADTSKLADIEQTDMLFIDTLHDCAQVDAELKHGNRARKYIVFHDTVLFGCREESTEGPPRINHAIWQFLAANPHWRVKEHHANNCGLLVLERA